MKTKQNKLGSYLAVTVGAGCAASVAEGAVAFFGPGAQKPSSTPATPAGFLIHESYNHAHVDYGSSSASVFGREGSTLFTRGNDLAITGTTNTATYFSYGFIRGAVGGSENYANISLIGGADGVYESVGQFYFDGAGGGYLIALATNEDNSALSISEGISLIGAVPEPSSLALLALGSAGLVTRRNRKKAA